MNILNLPDWEVIEKENEINNARRKSIDAIRGRLEGIAQEISPLLGKEQEACDAEKPKESARDALQQASDAIGEALSCLEEAAQ